MAGATTFREAEDCVLSFEKVSRIPMTVPKRPMNGEVEAMIESQVRPLVETLIASEEAASRIALLGTDTRVR